MKWIGMLVLCLGFLACGQSTKQAGEQSTRLVNPQQAEEMLLKKSDLQLVDVRTPEEHNQGHIEGSILIDFRSEDFEKKLATLDKEKPVIVYCARGGRSASACETMQKLGFKELYDVDGGYTSWSKH